ncbi:MAG TPA: PQQ-binding-like beta-propeller repeat protein [Gemmataceae bacterium]|nr:PQQ-binding-like beta-propeller repeat protein [Gemmataceae bacterium]
MDYASRMAGAIVGCAALLSASGVYAQDWPQWRGPHRDAKVQGFKVPQTWPKELTQKWKVTVGTGDATPALVGDKLYVFSRQGSDEVLRCLDATTGKEAWQDKYPAPTVSGPASGHGGPRSSPAVADGKVVTLGVSGILSCYDAATGKKLWRKDEIQGYPRFYTSSSPIIVDGLCVAQLGGSSNGAIVAYDLATGNPKWKWTGDSPAYASPALMTADGTKLVVAETQGKIVALNAADGKEVWQAACNTKYNASSPIIEGQTLIYTSSDGAKDVKLEKEGGGFAAKQQWNNKENNVLYNTPVVKDGLIYGLSQTNQFFCIDAKTGKTLWTASAATAAAAAPPAGGAPGGQGARRGGRGGMGGGYGSIVDAGSVLLALTPSMQLIVFAPSDKEFKPLANYKVAATGTYAYPVVSGNRIWIKDQDSVTLWTVE